jgi:hypothetical protein
MIAAKERVTSENDLLTVDPIFQVLTIVIFKHPILYPRSASSGT